MRTDRDDEPGAPGLDGLQALLFTTALTAGPDELARVCQEHRDEIVASFETWARVPEWARRDEATTRGWVAAVMRIAQQMAALGHPALLEHIAGRDRDNPAVRWRDAVLQAQKLAENGEYGPSSSVLLATISEMETASGTMVDDLRIKAFGALGANAARQGDYPAARAHTARALAAARTSEDADAVRAYSENLDVLTAMEEAGREGGPSGEIFHCRARIAAAQKLSDAIRYEASNAILRTIEAEIDARPDTAASRYEGKVFGLLGLNCFRLHETVRARQYTERALAACRRGDDADGVRIYTENLAAIQNSEGRIQHSE
jgi:hypothetical protein